VRNGLAARGVKPSDAAIQNAHDLDGDDHDIFHHHRRRPDILQDWGGGQPANGVCGHGDSCPRNTTELAVTGPPRDRPVIATQQNPRLPEKVVSVSALQGGYNGVRIDVTGFDCIGPVSHQFRHTEETRASVVLEEIGGHCERRLRRTGKPHRSHAHHMYFAPAGLEMWGYTGDVRFVRDATLSFDIEKLSGPPSSLKTSSTPRACDLRTSDLGCVAERRVYVRGAGRNRDLRSEGSGTPVMTPNAALLAE